MCLGKEGPTLEVPSALIHLTSFHLPTITNIFFEYSLACSYFYLFIYSFLSFYIPSSLSFLTVLSFILIKTEKVSKLHFNTFKVTTNKTFQYKKELSFLYTEIHVHFMAQH